MNPLNYLKALYATNKAKYKTNQLKKRNKWLEAKKLEKEKLEIRINNFYKRINFEAHKKIHSMDTFEGTLQDYINLKGKDFEIIDSNEKRQKIIITDYWFEIKRDGKFLSRPNQVHSWDKDIELAGARYDALLQKGLCAFVYCDNFHMHSDYFSTAAGEVSSFEGMPVREKNNS